MAKQLARTKRRQRLLAELQVQQLERQQRLERQLFKTPPLSPGLYLETAGVHPHLLENQPQPDPLLLVDRERTHLPLPTPEELEPMEPAETQLAALLNGPGPQPS
jgi:hypothetical protein